MDTKHFQQNVDKIKIALRKEDTYELNKDIDKAKTQHAYDVSKAMAENDKSFIFGRYIGFVEGADEALHHLNHEESFREYLDSLTVVGTITVVKIIAVLCHNDGQRLGLLANVIEIDEKDLVPIIEKLVTNGVVRTSTPGKFTYCYITEFGNRYCNKNRALMNVILAKENLFNEVVDE